jgi:hypothetical protein
VNVQGWGHNVTTTGYGGLYFAEGMNLLYTNGFNGTSSASPIVASAVASIEGIVEAETGLPAHPALVRALLERTGSPQQSGAFPVAQYHIGPRPDLRAATQRRGIPIVVARDAVVTKEEVPLDLRIHAGDLDGEPIQSLLASPLPSGATYTVGQDALTATLEWTPSRGQAGVYTIVFTASNGTSASDTTVITVESIELPPAIAAPASESGMEGEPQTIPVSTSDPNGDPIVSFTATGLPAGASFVLDATGTSGSLVWTPDFMQAGVHLITLEATSIPLAPPGSAPVTTTATVSWSITNVDRPPNLSVPINLAGAEGVPLTLSVTAVDPDGDSLQSLTAQGLPQGASFESSPDFSSGTLSWLPGFDQSGTYSVQFRCSNALEATVTTTLHIAHVDRPPVITVPTNVHGVEGVRIELDVFATDPDGDPIVAFESAGLPPGSQFLPVTDLSSAHFDWIPDFGQAGNYEIFLSATSADRALPVSGTMSTSTATLGISVASGNRPPVSDAGGPYFGLASIGIFLDGTGSSDPDGDPLTYDWDFGDGTTGTGPQPLHAFPAGQFTVALTVQDGTLSDRDETSATIQAVLEARTYLFGGGGALRLGSGKPTTCVQIEPVGGAFEADEIDPSSVSMRSAGTGSVDHIVAIADKTTTGEDRDRNGIREVTACFAKEDLRRLFDGLPAGRNLVPVTLTGALTRGGEFRGTLNLTVIQSGGISASISPNPTAGKAVLTFRTAVPGRAKVSLFGVSGRLVGTLLDGTLPAGYHDVPIGDDRSGQRLGAGIYFYRIEAGAEVLAGRFSVVR